MQQREEHELEWDTSLSEPIPAADGLEELARYIATIQEAMERLGEGIPPFDSEKTPTDVLEELQSNIEELRASHEMLAQTRQAVEVERQRYQELFESAPHGYLVTDMQGVIQEANRAAAGLLGMMPHRLARKPLTLFIEVAFRSQFRNLMQRVIERREACEWEGEMRRRPGMVFHAALTAVTACGPAGYAVASPSSQSILWILRDITVRVREEQMLRKQTEALTTTLSIVAIEPELDAFLHQLLSVVGEQLQATQVALWYYDGIRHLWTFGMQQGMKPRSDADVARHPPLPAHEWRLWHELVQTRMPVTVTDLAFEARITTRDEGEFPVTGSLLLVPMLLGDEVIGMLHVYSVTPRHYEGAAIPVAQALAQQATLAVQLTRLAEREQQSLVLRERNRMAREIHDTLAQGFTGIAIQLEAAEDTLDSDNAQTLAHIVRARELARRSLTEARRSVYALRPELLEHHDLPGAISGIVEEVTVGTGMTVQFQILGDPKPLPADIEDHLLRIAQEALTNVLKHADAQHVEITVDYGETEVELTLHDDGRGFAVTKPRSGGMGLIGMRERTVRIGGRFELESSHGHGTRIAVTAPLR